jgi:CTP-dependent riboflavin kinase
MRYGDAEYPADQIELLSEVHLRTELGLSDGDGIAVSIG